MEPSTAHQHPEEDMCGECQGAPHDEMAQCDECKLWFYYECVGVSNDQIVEEWKCRTCHPPSQGESPDVDSGLGTVTREINALRLELEDQRKKIREEKEAMEAEITRLNRNLNKDRVCVKCDKMPSVKMLVCEACKKWFHLECAGATTEMNKEKWRCDTCEPPSRAANASDELSIVTQEMYALRKELANQRRLFQEERRALQEEITKMSRHRHEAHEQQHHAFGLRNPVAHSTRRPSSTPDRPYGLTSGQLAARNVVSGKLPMFSGNPDEWSNFKSRFDTTTRMCGYTDDENVLRLQECLSGRALKMVQSRLQEADNVQDVMNALERFFGRSEVLVDGILQQIRSAPAPKLEKMQTLIDYGVAVEELCATIKARRMNEQNHNSSLMKELVDRLPPCLKLMWGIHKETLLTNASLQEYGFWMRTITNAAVSVTPPPQPPMKRNDTKYVNAHIEPRVGGPTPRNEFACVICQADDCSGGPDCQMFLSSSLNERWGLVRRYRLCRGCLWKHPGRCHVSAPCSRNGCTVFHHDMLHGEASPRDPAATLAHNCISEKALLRYVPVTLYGHGKQVNTFALLDDGSSVSLMDHALLDELNIEGTLKPICLRWTGNQTREENQSQTVAVSISGIDKEGKRYTIPRVHTVAKLALPTQSLPLSELAKKYEHLRKAYAHSYHEAIPRILIGVNNFYLTRPLKTIEGSAGEPFATKTRLGWVICGPHNHYSSGKHTESSGVHLCTCTRADSVLDATLRDYFMAEKDNNRPNLLSKDDERAFSLLNAHTKLVEGRYETCLLWRSDNISLPDNRRMALHRMECLEKRLRKDKELGAIINKKLEDYLEKGYVRKISDHELTATRNYPRKWYLPIFPVTNPSKPGKVRLVWDAAAAVRETSLNTCLLTGPDLLTPLPLVLNRFREYRFAVAADIREMYHQVMIRREDEHSQRFLWRWGDVERDPEEFVMTRMTFGATCSPSSAQYVKNINAERFIEKFPLAVRWIKEQHYVDDLLASAEREDDAVKLATEVQYIHEQGGFQLHNWLSNSSKVAETFSGNLTQQRGFHPEPLSYVQKVLGMWWNQQTDTFSFKLMPKRDENILDGESIPTKRQILRVLMSIFDPLGLIAGFLLYLKAILQEVWRLGIDWDEEIPQDILHKWKQWLTGLPFIQQITIPRCYHKSVQLDDTEIQLHVFVDAGRDGYAAVAYLRFQHRDEVEVSLVGGKAKVAPVRYMSIPRLELQAAVVGSRLATTIQKSHDQSIDRRFLWTDSRDVMCWINSDHRKYSISVGHRVGEILENTDTEEWRWVPTKLNVADECTKWTNFQHHLKSSQWFSGPEFLRRPIQEWPTTETGEYETEEEAKMQITVHKISEPIFQYDRFSSWRKLLRTIGYVWRFVYNTRNPSTRRIGALTSIELQLSERSILKAVQQQSYPEEYKLLNERTTEKQKQAYLKRSSSLYKRSPYLDEEGLLRVKGRIDACSFVDANVKRPIILPKSGVVVDLIIDHYHRKLRHGNHETVLNEVRTKFDIPALRRACRRVRNNCLFCRIRETKSRFPMMSQLPPARLAAHMRPFSFTGIDYFGPMIVSTGRGKTEKRWGVLFTCMTIRAVHIEVAHSLSTDACILAIRNFMARRGTPNLIYSDNGTNFVGASRELSEASKRIDTQRLMEEIDIPDTTWIFNPPSAPHYGGAWERMIGTVKRNLEKMPFRRLPTDPVLTSMLIEVESMINMRPLTHVPVDKDEEAPLTPNHFLLGSSSGVKPLPPPDVSSATLRNTWATAQVYANILWEKWLKEYLPTLTKRTKWFEPSPPIAVGDLVLIVDENNPRNCWPRGRVIETTPSKDGEVRRVVIKTAKGTRLERPSVKVVVLDVGQDKGATANEPSHGGECQQ